MQRVTAARIFSAAQYAQAAYETSTEAFTVATGLQKVALVRDAKTGALAFVAWKDSGTAIVAFRGTASRSDALAGEC